MVSNPYSLDDEREPTTWSPYATELMEKICDHSAVVGVIGLGYVGLPLAITQAKAGFHVIGVDQNSDKVGRLNQGENYIPDIPDDNVRSMLAQNYFEATTEYSSLARADVVCIAVPTPLTRHKDPDLSYIEQAGQLLQPFVHPGQLIILESTTYPGTTEDVLLPIVAQGRWNIGREVFLAFSPERVDPGNKTYRTDNTPKLVGGVGSAATKLAAAFYAQAIREVTQVSSPRIAEMAKVFENTYRAVNIALVNEMAMLCDRMGLDMWEVLDAAGTKPFGIQIFHPGPGVGGHCIPLDPYYLAWKAKEYDMPTRFIDLAGQINQGMPYFVVDKLQALLNMHRHKPLRGSKILLLGVAYKKDINDARESPALQVWSILLNRGADVIYHDPWVPRVPAEWIGSKLVSSQESTALSREILQTVDAVVIATDHSVVDYGRVLEHATLVFDTRNVAKGAGNRLTVFKL